MGLEPTPAEYVAKMVAVFAEVRRVLRKDGVCFINMGDSYYTSGSRHTSPSLKPKDLVGIPWRLAFALQDDGWWLRQDIIWHKPNPMPESVTDRCTKAHEYIFLLSKSARYHYDADAIKEPASGTAHSRGNGTNPKCFNGSNFNTGKTGEHQLGRASDKPRSKQNPSFSAAVNELVEDRNKRSVWTVSTQAFNGAQLLADYVGSDGKPYRVSEDCPVHGLRREYGIRQKASYDEQPTSFRNGNAGIPTHHDQAHGCESSSTQLPDGDQLNLEELLEPIAQNKPVHRTSGADVDSTRNLLRIEDTSGISVCNSDSSFQSRSGSATSHSSENRKMDLAPETTSPCIASAESPHGISRSEASRGSAGSAGRTFENSISRADSDGHPSAQTQSHISGKVAQCNCTVISIDHFATFPEELIVPCILAGCPIGGTVLDPFSGSGTTGVVALRYHRNYIGIELSPEYAAMSERRIRGDAPLFNHGEVTA